MKADARVLAVDLGATTGRVAAVTLGGGAPPRLELVHRFPHHAVRHADGSLRWDWDRLVAEVLRGLEKGFDAGPVDSIGVDTWGVDFGLVDRAGTLLSPPHSYRSERTSRWHAVARRLGTDRLYNVTGIQLMGINTVFQLAAHDPDELARAHRLLLLPELLLTALGAPTVGERSSAATTGMVDLATGDWSAEVVDALGLRPTLLPELLPAGTRVGKWRGAPLHLVGGHDTASAVVARPGETDPHSAFISSGSWLLVGAERDRADVSDRARVGNFSNERGALGGVRLLKNVVGLGMLEACRPGWGDPPIHELVEEAARVRSGPIVDATDQRFLAPADMAAEIRAAAQIPASEPRSSVVRCILDSICSAAARVVGEIGELGGHPVSSIDLLGGGARIPLLVDLLSQSTGLPVRVGPAEATALGNALVQGIAIGCYSSLVDARRALAS